MICLTKYLETRGICRTARAFSRGWSIGNSCSGSLFVQARTSRLPAGSAARLRVRARAARHCSMRRRHPVSSRPLRPIRAARRGSRPCRGARQTTSSPSSCRAVRGRPLRALPSPTGGRLPGQTKGVSPLSPGPRQSPNPEPRASPRCRPSVRGKSAATAPRSRGRRSGRAAAAAAAAEVRPSGSHRGSRDGPSLWPRSGRGSLERQWPGSRAPPGQAICS
jgi:hypothetical protein